MTQKRLSWLVLALAFVWMAFVFASFYLVRQQRPLSEVHVRAIASTLLDLLCAGGITLVAASVGARMCVWLGIEFDHPAEILVWGTGAGLGLISLCVLGIGLLGWLTRWVAIVLLIALFVGSLPGLARVGRAVASLHSAARPNAWLSAYLVTMLVLTLLLSLTPPLDWDGLFYHLTLPRLYIEQGRVAPVTDMPHQYFPSLMEMLYMAAMLLRGDSAAKLLHYAFLVLLGGAVYLLAQRHLRQGYGWPAVTAFAAMPMVWVLGGWAYNDLALAFCQVAALWALLSWFRRGTWRWLALSGVFCGLALGVKYTAFVCPVALALFACWHLWRARATWQVWLRALAVLCGVALLVAAPWYLRNLALTGNPVYPFGHGLLGGPDWDAWRAAWYARAGTGLGWNIAELIRLPWTLTLGLRDMNFHDGRAGPLFLLALPFLIAWIARLFGRPGPRPPALGYVLAFSAAQFAFWTLGVMSSRSLFQARLLLPMFAVLCPPLAYLYDELRTLDTRLLSLRRLVGLSVVLVLALNLTYVLLATYFYPSVMRIRPLAVLVGEESRDAFLSRNLGSHYAAMQLVNERVPREGRVLFLWEPRSYYCEPAAQPDAILERWAWLMHRYGGNVDAIARALGQEYTHVLLWRSRCEAMRETRMDPLSDADLAGLDALIEAHLAPEGTVGDGYELYSLKEPTAGGG